MDLDGPIYANPLVARGLLIVATQHDTIYALDPKSGCVVWSTSVGQPVDATGFPCGNIPLVGITSTPAIDLSSDTIFAAAFLQPAHHELFALDLKTGTVRWHRPADAPGTNPTVQLQRPALLTANGRVYLAFGGRAGDCGDFHGYVEGFPVNGSGQPDRWFVPTTREGGIWAPGGAALLPDGDLLVPVGNSASQDPAHYDGGNSVTRLSPDLKVIARFMPANWVQLNHTDFDLGSTTPIQVGGGLAFQSGKDAIGYLLDVDHLDRGPIYRKSLGECYAIGAAAYRSPYVYVTCDHGMKAVRITDRSFEVAWTAANFRSGSPIVAGGVVWNIDFEGGHLWGFDAGAGDTVAKAQIPIAQHFVSPTSSSNRLFVPAGRRLLAFSTDK